MVREFPNFVRNTVTDPRTECTYDQPSNRRRNPTPQYIEALENRVQRLADLLKLVLPDVDIDHPDFDVKKISQFRQVSKKISGKDGTAANIPATSVSTEPQEALL